MGGGGSSRAQREAEAREREIAALRQRQYDWLLNNALQEDPLEAEIRGENLDFLRWERGENGPMDIEQAPGMGAHLSLFRRARDRQAADRQGIGALRLGLESSNPEIASRIAEQRQTEREQDAAGALENAYNVRRAEVRGSSMPLIAGRQARNMGLVGVGAGQENAARSAYLGFLGRPRQRGFWSSLLLGTTSGLAGGLGAGLGSDD